MLLHAPMKLLARRRWLASWSIVMAVSCATIGCDKVESLVDDAKKEVANQTAPAAPVPAAPANTAAPVVAPTPAPIVPTVSPDQILAEFRAAPGNGLTDASLAKLAAVPEAAAQITELDLTNNQVVSGTGFSELAKLPNLKTLKIAGMAKLEPQAFNALQQLTGLASLEANNTQLNNSNLSALASMTGLESLNLSQTQVGGNGAAQLSALTNLKELSLSGTTTNDEAINGLKNLPLKVLRLNNAPVTNVGMAVIGDIETLEELTIAFTSITGAGFAKAKFPNLRILNAGEMNFGIDGLINLKRFKNLEEVGLYRAQLVMDNGKQFDAKADSFKGLPKLRSLVLSENGLTDLGVLRFIAGAKELEELKLSGPGITNQSLKDLLKCPKLRLVDITRTQISEAGVVEFKAFVAKQNRPEIVVIRDGVKH